MSKHCGLRDVTAEKYRNELVRDAFINGIASHSIRQRLLENSELTVTQAFHNARSLRTAQERSAAYLNQTEVASILPQLDTIASIECCVKLVRPSFWLSAVILTDLLLP